MFPAQLPRRGRATLGETPLNVAMQRTLDLTTPWAGDAMWIRAQRLVSWRSHSWDAGLRGQHRRLQAATLDGDLQGRLQGADDMAPP